MNDIARKMRVAIAQTNLQIPMKKRDCAVLSQLQRVESRTRRHQKNRSSHRHGELTARVAPDPYCSFESNLQFPCSAHVQIAAQDIALQLVGYIGQVLHMFVGLLRLLGLVIVYVDRTEYQSLHGPSRRCVQLEFCEYGQDCPPVLRVRLHSSKKLAPRLGVLFYEEISANCTARLVSGSAKTVEPIKQPASSLPSPRLLEEQHMPRLQRRIYSILVVKRQRSM